MAAAAEAAPPAEGQPRAPPQLPFRPNVWKLVGRAGREAAGSDSESESDTQGEYPGGWQGGALLGNGRVYLFGGEALRHSRPVALAGTWQFDPAPAAAGTMLRARSCTRQPPRRGRHVGFAAAGAYWVHGGRDGGLADPLLSDWWRMTPLPPSPEAPAQCAWEQVAVPGPSDGRAGASACAWEGRIYILGGWLQRAEGREHPEVFVAFDPADLSITSLRGSLIAGGSQAPGLRAGHSAAIAEGDHRLFVYGGQGAAGDCFSDAPERCYDRTYCFDLRAQTWRQVAVGGNVPRPRQSHGCCTFAGKIYIYGGMGPQGHFGAAYEFAPPPAAADAQAEGRWRMLRMTAAPDTPSCAAAASQEHVVEHPSDLPPRQGATLIALPPGSCGDGGPGRMLVIGGCTDSHPGRLECYCAAFPPPPSLVQCAAQRMYQFGLRPEEGDGVAEPLQQKLQVLFESLDRYGSLDHGTGGDAYYHCDSFQEHPE
eukprot:TRINITY_DN9266_c0_g1_i1.p1 TRINITY_DN9266_c0_g1~~TRINITY_DN9266_c0_g1_i1.p1  ORF type:complete len:508 (+),score=156.16 TRINITY_DN9266_c0_g1_i1:79-1524(+)